MKGKERESDIIERLVLDYMRYVREREREREKRKEIVNCLVLFFESIELFRCMLLLMLASTK